jgi:ATP-dependent RNA helicase DeaD
MTNFEEFGIQESVLKAIKELGFEKPTEIQQKTIPLLVQNPSQDLMGLAQTGTGKTASFGLPLLQKIDFSSTKIQGLVLSPTRELCVQIKNDLNNYAKYIKGAKITAIYGGTNIRTQINELRQGTVIVVATPGRLMDLMERGEIKLEAVQTVILDEADEMLNMGFQEDIDHILSFTPKEKAVWLFSATMPDEVRRISKRYMDNPEEVSSGHKNSGATNISHEYYLCKAREKYEVLKRVVDLEPDMFGIVFCKTKIETQEVAERLSRDGYNSDALHGDLSQQQRDKVMARFRTRGLKMLIATDVAARGIDVNDVTHVIHYSLPDDVENYTHRSGRTARAGKSGKSLALVNSKEIGKVRQIEKIIRCKFEKMPIPSGKDVCEKRLIHLIEEVENTQVDEKELAPFWPAIQAKLENFTKEELMKKMFYHEFKRFLVYYKDSTDLNESSDSRSGSYTSSTGEEMCEVFINLGIRDQFEKGGMIRFLCDTTGLNGAEIERLRLKPAFSFFNIPLSKWPKVEEVLNSEMFNNRQVRVEMAGGSSASSSEGGREGRERRSSGGYRGGRERSFSRGGGGNRRESGGGGGSREGGFRRDSSSGSRPRRDSPSGGGGGSRRPSGGGGGSRFGGSSKPKTGSGGSSGGGFSY